jgi:hypothetical protein
MAGVGSEVAWLLPVAALDAEERCAPGEGERGREGRVLTGGRGWPAQDDESKQVQSGASGGEAGSKLKLDRGSSSSNGCRGQAPAQPPQGAR